jgi:myo-inositol-1(or 4)-monophosphatase
MQPTLNELEQLARQAGEIVRLGFNPRPGSGNHLQIEHKGEIDLVTEIDHRSEAFIIQEIRQRYPQDVVLAEESGQTGESDCCIWYVDPLDGTVNFAHGVPLFAVSIAYQRNGSLELGVIYDPIQDECFSAERSKGAWLNGKPIHASNTKNVIDSLLVTGFPYDIRTNPENNLDHYARLSKLTQGVRRLGTAALDLSYVAAGRFDGFWEISISPWDIAAGGLIAREAGAVVTDATGNPDFLKKGNSILAANPYLHPLILDQLRTEY